MLDILIQTREFCRSKLLNSPRLLRALFILAFILVSSSTRATNFNDPLVDAADLGDVEQVTKLIKEGAQPDSKGDFGTTALMRAAFRGNTHIIEILLESGAYINAADIGGETALHLAAKNGHLEAVKSLIHYGAYVDVPDKEKWTPLMRATLAKQPDVVKTLLDKGADVTAMNSIKESVLVHAAISGVPDIAAMITGSNKAKDISKDQEEKAIKMAKKKKHENVEKVISDFAQNKDKAPAIAGAKPDVPISIDEEKTDIVKPSPAQSTTSLKDEKEPDSLSKLIAEKPSKTEAGHIPVAKDISYESAGIFFVQLGNYSDTAGAEAGWDTISSVNKEVLSGLSPKIIKSTSKENASGAVYRLRAGTFQTRIEADNACRSIRAKSFECYVVEITSSPDEKNSAPKTADSGMAKPSKFTEDYLTPIVEAPISSAQPLSSSSALSSSAFSGSYPKLAGTALPSSTPLADSSAPIDIQEALQSGNLPSTPIPPQISGSKDGSIKAEPIEPITNSAPKNIEYSYPNSRPDAKSYPSLAKKDTTPMPQTPLMQTPLREPAPVVLTPPNLPQDNSEFIAKKEQARNEVEEMTRENFFRKQGITPPARPKKEYDDFYKQMENNAPKEAPVSEAVLVPDETYFTGSKPDNFAQSSGGNWITISNLPSEAFANDYGMRMFKKDESLGNVQVIVMKALAAPDAPQTVSMRVGPLSPSQTGPLCSAVNAGGFSCDTSGGSASQTSVESGFAPPPTLSSAKRAPAESPENPFTSQQSESASEYWINLGTFASNSEAEYYWMFIKEDNGDVLNSMKYNLTNAKGSGNFADGAIQLRTGPFSAKQRASQLCNIMRYRNIACLVTE